MDINRIAHELHRLRKGGNSSAPRHQAAGEAVFWGVLGREPDADDYDHYMNMFLTTPNGIVTVMSSVNGVYEINMSRSAAVDHFIFSKGERLAETELVGWLPYDRVNAAPRLNRDQRVLVNEACLFPIPERSVMEEGAMVEPVIDSPGVWDYDLGAMWTPLGFSVYDDNLASLVYTADGARTS